MDLSSLSIAPQSGPTLNTVKVPSFGVPPPPVTPSAPAGSPSATPKPVAPPPPVAPAPAAPAPAASSTTQNSTETPPATPTLSDKADRDAITQALQDYQTKAKQFGDTVTGIQNGSIPLSAGENAQLDGVKQQFQTLIDQQNLQNQNMVTGQSMLDVRNGVFSGAPGVHMANISKVMSDGAAKVADLMTKESSAVATLTQSLKDNDISAIKDAFSAQQDVTKARIDAFNKAIDDTTAAINKAQDAQQKVTDGINDVATTAAKNGADAKTLAAIHGSGNVGDAIEAAGSAMQTSTNPEVAQYLFYKQQATNSGQTPISYDAYQAQQNSLANSKAYSKAFATAAGSAAGAASILPDYPTGGAGDGLGGTSSGQSILAATGLSIGAFNYLVGNTSALSRLTASQRQAIMNEVTNFANKNGVDVSTIISQYKSLNDVLGGNIARENNAKIKGNDVTKTAQQLIASLATDNVKPDPLASVHGGGSKLGNLKVANILDIAAGKQVNSPFAVKYGTTISLLANDLSGYLAATRTSSPTGNASPDDSDKLEAATMVYNGLNAGGLQAFNDVINQNVTKIAGVSQQAVTDTQKQVWGLFGVGDQYKTPTNANDQVLQTQQQQQDVINKFVSANPDKASSIANLYTQGFSDEQVAEYLGLNQ